jgi:hypothetical protein
MTSSARHYERSWTLSTPYSFRPLNSPYPPYGSTQYSHLTLPVHLSHPQLAKHSVKHVKKQIEATRHQIQTERIAAEEFLLEIAPHLDQQFDPHDQTVLNHLFIKFERFRDTLSWHAERLVSLMHQERRKCSEYARLLRKPTLLVKPELPRDLHDLEELQTKYNRAAVAIGDRLAFLARRGARNPRLHRRKPRVENGATEVFDVRPHPSEMEGEVEFGGKLEFVPIQLDDEIEGEGIAVEEREEFGGNLEMTEIKSQSNEEIVGERNSKEDGQSAE